MMYGILANRGAKPVLKVGFSEPENWRKRVNKHRRPVMGVPQQIEFLWLLQADRTAESATRRVFLPYRLSTGEFEVYEPVPLIADWFRWLREQYYVYVPDDEVPLKPELLDELPYDVWKPTDEHRREPPPAYNLYSPPGNLCFPPRVITPDDFYTPERFIQAVRETMEGGDIDLDPASCAHANALVRAKEIYTKASNGLLHPWRGRVWLNPPFSQWASWVGKIVREYQRGEIPQMCVLSAGRTITTQRFSPIHLNCAGMCVINGRHDFWGGLAARPDDGHVIFYFGIKPERFKAAFRDLGVVYNHMPDEPVIVSTQGG